MGLTIKKKAKTGGSVRKRSLREETARAKHLKQERVLRAEAESAKQRIQFLAESGDILASSLDYNATLTRLAQHAVKTVCDWCAVGLLDDDGVLRRIALAVENHLLYEEAREASSRRDELIAIATHDIRTPLVALQLHLRRMRREMERDDAGGVKDQKWERLSSMNLLGEKLARMVEDLFDLSHLNSHEKALKLEECNLTTLVREALTILDGEIMNSGSSVTTQLVPDATGLWDGLHIQRVVVNLISNALKYGRGKPIEIVLEIDEAMACLEVRDHGVGISDVNKERIFHRFARLNPGGNTLGLGLSLYIARQVVEMHGGRLHVTSTPDQGSNFLVALPRGLVAARAASSVTARPAEPGMKRRILVVDDNEDTRYYLKTVLEAEGYQVTQATQGAEALELLRLDALPHLILTDIFMPVMDGRRFVMELRKDPFLAGIPVVLLSEHDLLPNIAEELQLPDWLPKNRASESILKVVGRYCTH